MVRGAGINFAFTLESGVFERPDIFSRSSKSKYSGLPDNR